jgi:hypothetical protein
MTRVNPETHADGGLQMKPKSPGESKLRLGRRRRLSGVLGAGGGSGEYHPVVTRPQADGASDETFGDVGSVVTAPDFSFWSVSGDIVLQQDGKIVLLADAIYQQSFALARLFAA